MGLESRWESVTDILFLKRFIKTPDPTPRVHTFDTLSC